jgi:glycosyltransferase involved in cell wall biosynthesis
MEKSKEKKTLGLFFTKGVSVQLWKEKGLLDREKIIYEKLIEKKYFSKIYWFTYGISDKKYAKGLNENIEIVPMPKLFNFKRGALVYSFVLPLLRRKYLKKACVYKTNQMMGSWVAIISKWCYQKPVLIRTGYTLSLFSQQKIKKGIVELIERLAYRFADFSTVSSQNDLNYIKKRYRVKNIALNPNYIDLNIFKGNYSVKKNGKIVFVGRLSGQKNLFGLLAGLKDTKYVLDVYGFGEEKEKLKQFVLINKVNVNFMGTINNNILAKRLPEYEIFILPSFYEGMPKALLEAMSCGLPCIGTNVRGINEVINHGENGWLVKTDSKSVGAGIKRLMNDKKLREKLGKSARKTIEEKYSLEKVLKKEIEIYSRLLKV